MCTDLTAADAGSDVQTERVNGCVQASAAGTTRPGSSNSMLPKGLRRHEFRWPRAQHLVGDPVAEPPVPLLREQPCWLRPSRGRSAGAPSTRRFRAGRP